MSTSVPPPGDEAPAGCPRETPAEPAPPVVREPGRGRPARSRLLAGALGVVGIAVLAFVVFGSPNSPLTDPIARAATTSSHTAGFRMHMNVAISTPVLSSPITATADGVVDLRDQAASLAMVIDFSHLPQASQGLGSTPMRMGMIVDRHVIYMKLPHLPGGQDPSLGGKPWIRMDLGKVSGGSGISSLPTDPTTTDPTQVLRYLTAASDGVTNLGQQVIGGVQTTRYQARLNLDRLPDNLPAAAQGPLRQALSKLQQATQIHDLPVDVWIDSGHLVRQMRMSLGLHLPSGPGLQETVTMSMTDYGPQPRPTPPPADQVRDLSSLAGANGAGTSGLSFTPAG